MSDSGDDHSDSASDFLDGTDKQNDFLRLKAALNAKDVELIEMRQQQIRLMNTARNAREQLESAVATKDQVIQQLENALETLNRKCRDTDRTKSELQTMLETVMAELQRERRQTLEETTQLHDLKKNLHTTETRKTQLEAEQQTQQHELDASRNELARAEMHYRQELATIKASAAKKIEMAVEKLRHAEDTHERVLKDNKALRQELDRREADLSSLSDRYQERHDRLLSLRSGMHRDQLSIKRESSMSELAMVSFDDDVVSAIAREIHSIRQQLKSKDDGAKKYKEACRTLKYKYESLQSRFSAQRNEIRTLTENTRQQLHCAREKEYDDRKKIARFESELDRTCRLLCDKDDCLKHKEREMHDLKTKLQECDAHVADLDRQFQAQKQAFQSEMSRIKSQLDLKCVQNEELRQRNATVEQKARDSKAATVDGERRLREMSNTFHVYHEKTDQITEKLESLQREHDKVSDRMKATEDQKALLHQKLNATEISLESTKNLLADTQKKLLEAEERALESEKAKQTMAAHVPRYQTQLDQQQSLFDDIQEKYTSLLARSEEDQKCIRRLQNQLCSKETHIEYMNTRLKEVTERNSEMERLISEAEQIMCKQRVKVRSDCAMKVAEMKNEIDQTRNEKNAQLKRLRNEQELAEEQVKELNSKVESSNASVRTLNQLVECLKLDLEIKSTDRQDNR